MSSLNFILGGVNLPMPTVPFLTRPLEASTDLTTLDETLYTDFTNRKSQYTLNWARLFEDDYDSLFDVYTTQFITGEYPVFEVPYLGISVPVRVIINDRDLRKDGCWVRNVQVTLIERQGVLQELS